MWLTFKNRILTRVNLRKRGWEGDPSCVFCSCNETANHLFLNCQLVRHVLQWVGNNTIDCTQWGTLQEVFEFAVTLPSKDRTVFLIIFSAVCWTIWKHRNEVCFNNSPPKTARALIYLIISLVVYWTGHKKTKPSLKTAARGWMPTDEMMDAIPLRVIFPGEENSISFHLEDEESSS